MAQVLVHSLYRNFVRRGLCLKALLCCAEAQVANGKLQDLLLESICLWSDIFGSNGLCQLVQTVWIGRKVCNYHTLDSLCACELGMLVFPRG